MTDREILLRAGLAIGLAGVASLLFWAFTGLTLWAPIEPGSEGGRAVVLVVVHLASVVIGIASIFGSLGQIDRKDKDAAR